MINRDIYQTDPSERKLVNEGVAYVNDKQTSAALDVIRYELETFVCDGQYEKGMSHILDTYLKNISNLSAKQQPAVWVSGFYGSGKSHLVKMLRALWSDTKFPDGATARGIADLPVSVTDHLKELTNQSRKYGGLHAASGTLGAGASGSVRLALLRVIFHSVGLPGQFPIASFIMWLRKDGIYDQVKSHVETNGHDWEEELEDFYVADALHSALVAVKPSLFSSVDNCANTLANMYPHVNDVSDDQMLKAINSALTKNGKFPLTLIVLDEVQQYLGENSDRSIAVQEMVESCCKNIGSQLLFIGTGQTAVTGTSNLKRLEGRFTLRIELSDADVDAVIRKVVLGKTSAAIPAIDKVMNTNLGEISRHLQSTSIGHQQDDIPFFSQDYPILPVRRRFWENTLRVLDQTGTDSQLRNQLSMIHKVIQTNLEAPLGSVTPADFLYFDSADKLLQSRILPRRVHEKTMSWINGSEDQKLMARASGLVFLINKLSGSNNEIGIKATVDTIADLLVEDLSVGSSTLRAKLPALLKKCELLMCVGSEYRIQTEESTAWNDEFLSQKHALNNEAHRSESERNDRLKKKFALEVKKLSIMQGKSKVSRDLFPIFDSQLPQDHEQKVCVWVRDGWNSDESSVLVDARQAGNTSPTIFVFIPKRFSDDLRHHLIDFKAASSTLDVRGVPITPEGKEARAAMETTKQAAEGKINELLNESFSGVRVFQGGGNEIIGNDLQSMIFEAADNSLKRLYPQFTIADHAGWEKVYNNAKTGSPDALKAVGFEDDPANNPVCKTILAKIAGGKKGNDIRDLFDKVDYGWSRDAIDGGLMVLLVSGLIRAEDERGKVVDIKSLERKQIGKLTFKAESITITTPQKIQIRKLLQKVGLKAKQGAELQDAKDFIVKLQELAENAGGEAPRPEKPKTELLQQLRYVEGNELLMALFNSKDELSTSIKDWQALSEKISDRLPSWYCLKKLAIHAEGLQDVDIILSQINDIETHRHLLEDPDPMTPLTQSLSQLLRDEINQSKDLWEAEWKKGEAKLNADENWKQLEQKQRFDLRAHQQLVEAAKPSFDVENTDTILETLNTNSLSVLRDRIAAMSSRFDAVSLGAAKLMEPEIQEVSFPSRTLKSEEDIAVWLKETETLLKETLKKGPVIV